MAPAGALCWHKPFGGCCRAASFSEGSYWVDIQEGHSLLAASSKITLEFQIKLALEDVWQRRKFEAYSVWEVYTLRYLLHHALMAKHELQRNLLALCDVRYVECKARAGLVFQLAKEYHQICELNLAAPALPCMSMSEVPASTTPKATPQLRESQSFTPATDLIDQGHSLHEAAFQFQRFSMQFGSLLAQRPHLTLQCAANWPKGLLPTLQAETALAKQSCPWIRVLNRPSSLSSQVTSMRHGALTLALDFTSDGGQVASAGADGKVKLWDVTSGELLLTMIPECRTQHAQCVFDIRFVGDVDRLAIGGMDGVHVWDTTTVQPIWSSQAMFLCRGLKSSRDGKQILSCGEDGSVRLWDAATGKELKKMMHGESERVLGIDMSPAEDILVSGGADGAVIVWSTRTGQEMLRMNHRHPEWCRPGSGCHVWSVAFSLCGTKVASGGRFGNVCVFDSKTGDLLFDFTQLPEGCAFGEIGAGVEIRRLRFVGSMLFVCSVFGSVGVRDAVSFAQHDLLRHGEGDLFGLDAIKTSNNRDEFKIVSSGADRLRIWTVSSKHVSSANDIARVPEIREIRFSPDGQKLAMAETDAAGSIRVLDAKTGVQELCVKHYAIGRNFSYSTKIEFLTDMRIVSAGVGIKLWDLQTGALLATFDEDHRVCALAVTKQYNKLASCSEQTIKIWDVLPRSSARHMRSTVSFEVTAEISEKQSLNRSKSICFSPCGQRLATTVNSRDHSTRQTCGWVQVWDVESHELLVSTNAQYASFRNSLNEVQFSSDGRTVSACADSYVVMWETDTGKELRRLKHGGGLIFSCDVSPNMIVSSGMGGNDANVKLWDSFGKQLTSFRHAACNVYSVCFSPVQDGLFASAGKDGNIRIWEATSYRQLAAFCKVSREEKSLLVQLSPSIITLASASFPGSKRELTTRYCTPDGIWLACETSELSAVRIIRVDDRKEFAYYDCGRRVEAAGFTSDGNLLLARSDGGLDALEVVRGGDGGIDWH